MLKRTNWSEVFGKTAAFLLATVAALSLVHKIISACESITLFEYFLISIATLLIVSSFVAALKIGFISLMIVKSTDYKYKNNDFDNLSKFNELLNERYNIEPLEKGLLERGETVKELNYKIASNEKQFFYHMTKNILEVLAMENTNKEERKEKAIENFFIVKIKFM